MGKVESLEKEVRQLSLEELSDFRQWFIAFDNEAWDRQIENDVGAGKLDALAARALAGHRRGESRDI